MWMVLEVRNGNGNSQAFQGIDNIRPKYMQSPFKLKKSNAKSFKSAPTTKFHDQLITTFKGNVANSLGIKLSLGIKFRGNTSGD